MNLLKENKISYAFVICTLLSVVTAFAIIIVLRLLRADITANMKLMIFCNVGSILMLRHYAKQELFQSLKGAILSLILTLGSTIILLLRYNYLELG